MLELGRIILAYRALGKTGAWARRLAYTHLMDESRRGYDATGILFVVLTLLGWSSVLLFLKHLAPHIDGWTANGWRYGVSALMWLPLLLVRRHRGTLPPRLFRRALAPSIVNIGGQAFFALMVYYIDPGFAAFLLRVSLIFSTGCSLFLFADERPLVRSPLFWVGMALVVAGAVGTVLYRQQGFAGAAAAGIAIGLTAGALFGLYGVAVRYWMRDVPSMLSFGAISQYTAAGMILLMLCLGKKHGGVVFELSAFNWFMLIASAVIGIGLGHVFYYASIARLGVAIAGAVIQLAPFLCGVASVMIFGEELTIGQWTSGGVLLVGALLLLLADQKLRRQRNRVTGMATKPCAPDGSDLFNSTPDSPAALRAGGRIAR